MTRRILLVAGGIITLIFALFVFAPGFAPIQALSTYFPFAQLLSFPRVFAPFVAALCVIVYLMTVLAAYVRRRRLAKVDGVRTPRRFVGLILICVMIVSSIWVVVAPSGHLTSETRPLQTGEAKDVTLVAFNTLRNLDGETMQYMIDRFDPDILVLPETSQLEVEEAILGTNFVGYSYVGTPDLGGASPTTVMTNPRLGIWHQRKGPNATFGTVTLQNTDSDMPMIVATHTSPPLPGRMSQWRADLENLLHYDSLDQPIIMAGDFNATLRHGFFTDLHSLSDAAVECGAANMGTWPVSVNSAIAAPIDHVLVSADIKVTGCEVFATDISDHRGIAVSIRLPVE